MKVKTPMGVATVLETHHEIDPYSHEKIDEYWVSVDGKGIKFAIPISECEEVNE
jgi:hypothetical protein